MPDAIDLWADSFARTLFVKGYITLEQIEGVIKLADNYFRVVAERSKPPADLASVEEDGEPIR